MHTEARVRIGDRFAAGRTSVHQTTSALETESLLLIGMREIVTMGADSVCVHCVSLARPHSPLRCLAESASFVRQSRENQLELVFEIWRKNEESNWSAV